MWQGTEVESTAETAAPESGSYADALSAAEEIAETISEKTGASIEVYNGIRVSETATVLNLSGRQLTGSMKAEIRHLSTLTELNLSNNQFTGLPAEVGQLAELQVLNLSNNPLTGLPYELGNLQKLRVLDLRGTSYAKSDLEIIRKQLPDTVQILVD